ncbi:hypothetical protein CC85DRAFT_282206 [Cutaneotrichosporon oleaginosum]|uniref:Uncharacterized protein n=1 Tax=Cutaneotrichosporon oleaginosum TaxID=879819 RepID=A0A0J0XWY3_9TREE|nr:uncharacterized protein CC85DRAFT_282206 [Cutaneotrichosporon oleaginosum]KLT45577.1 hypothetical protein CC85DRAFT_282206 [Cutaneotrichosporon oleaginosum]TXT04626.1 hypothetical protein COLE_07445 [Cutaneotrichosporon oleaginosum]
MTNSLKSVASSEKTDLPAPQAEDSGVSTSLFCFRRNTWSNTTKPHSRGSINKMTIIGPMSDGFAAIQPQGAAPPRPTSIPPSLSTTFTLLNTEDEDAVATHADLLAQLARAHAEITALRRRYTMDLRESNAVKYAFRSRVLYLEDEEKKLRATIEIMKEQEKMMQARVAQLERELRGGRI